MKYTQDSFLEDMCTNGYARVKASELRTLLQNYEKIKVENERLKDSHKAYMNRIDTLEISLDLLSNTPIVSLKA